MEEKDSVGSEPLDARRLRDCADSSSRSGLGVEGFRGLFFLLVSLLHGSLFFSLVESLLSRGEFFSLSFWTSAFVNLSVFFRVIQSQLAAALKYGRYWSMRPFDFISVFLAVLMEYLLFCHYRYPWGSGNFRSVLLTIFCIFGTLSYIGSLLRVRRKLGAKDLADERRIQLFNVATMACCTLLCVLNLALSRIIPLWPLEIMLGCAILLNLNVSMRQLIKSPLPA